MPRVRPQSNNIKISVSTQQTDNTVSAKTTDGTNPVKASNSMAEYWSNKSREWAISDNIVDGEDYSSKHYAEQSKESYDGIEELVDGFEETVISATNAAVNVVNETKNDAIEDVQDEGTTQITNVRSEGASQVSTVQSTGDGYISQMTSLKNQTEQYKNSAATSASNASTSETNASNSASNASSSATSAHNYADEAKDWANKMDGTVDGEEYSSKYYAANSSNSATSANNSASTATTKAQEASCYASSASASASEASGYASNASTSATNAHTSEVNAQTYASNANISATNASTSEDNANIWAEGTDAEVQALGGVHSSKGWAEQSATGQVQSDWNETDNTAKSYIRNKLDFYGTCDSNASSQEKVVVCPYFELRTGASIRVKFVNSQSYNGVPKLNVNGTGAIDVLTNDGTNAPRYIWRSGEIVSFTYDGTYWIIEDGGTASTTFYGYTVLATSATSTREGAALTPQSLNQFSQNMIANYPVYSNTDTYAVGDRVRYAYNAWECNTAITVAEAWNASHWTKLDDIQTQLDSKYPSSNPSGYITGINSSMVTTALGYTPYDSSNPNGYTSNVGTVTSVNNIQPDANGNVTISSGSSTDVQINGTSITSQGVANIITESTYNASSNKIATMSDLPASEIFVAKYNVTTYNEFINAYTSNKIIYCDDGAYLYYLNSFTGGVASFTTLVGLSTHVRTLNQYNTWSSSNYITLENQSNRVTSISSSSTNTEYPSAKSVIELLKTIYPVGSVYLSTNSTCPMASLFGTWTLVSSGKALWTGTGSNGNTTIAAGLPNITGETSNSVGRAANKATTKEFDGSMSRRTASGTSAGYQSSANSYNVYVGIDASKSSTIYSSSVSTVQPPAYVVNVWRRTA